jgi:exopolysaccharide production protein ExoZ
VAITLTVADAVVTTQWSVSNSQSRLSAWSKAELAIVFRGVRIVFQHDNDLPLHHAAKRPIPSGSSEGVKFELIQCLRAIAAIQVVAFHAVGATAQYSAYPSKYIGLFNRYGVIGVDLFFVISGFVIYYTSHGLSSGEFASKRLKRLVPIYWIFTLLVAAITAVGLTNGGTASPGMLLASLGFMSFALGEYPLIYVGWTLEFEMYFYAAVTLGLIFLRNPWPAVVGFLCIMIAAGNVLAPVHPVAVFVTKPIMLEFVAGVLIGQAFRASLGKTEFAFFAVAGTIVWVGGAPLLPLMACSLLVCMAVWFNSTAPNWAKLLGDASYSIYLVQVLTIPIVAKALKAIWPNHSPEILVVVAVSGTIIVGILTFRFIEKPVAKLLRRRSVSRPLPVA